MNKTRRFSLIASLICNTAVFLCTLGCILCFFGVLFPDNSSIDGKVFFIYFTTDSNILCGACSAVMMFFSIKALITGNDFIIPRWAAVVKLTGTAAVELTFFTVVLFLAPLYGFGSMFSGTNFFFHLLLPLLAAISFICFESKPRLKLIDAVWGMLPMIIYGTIYLTEVVIVKKWPDFYCFNAGGRWYITLAVMFAGTSVISLGSLLLRRAVSKSAE